MSMLARYKKPGAILELVKLIEDSSEPKRTQLLNMVRSEDPEFAAKVESRIFSYEMFKKLSENVIAEIVGATPPKFVAIAMAGEDPEFVKLIEKCLGKNFNDYKAEKENLAAAPLAANQVEAGRRKMIAEARKLEAAGQIKITSGNDDSSSFPHASSPPPSAPTTTAASAAPQSTAPAAPSPTAGSAKAEGGAPSMESFGLEPPVPGLSGERFETFLKGLLGR